jgi:hypothetical protein
MVLSSDGGRDTMSELDNWIPRGVDVEALQAEEEALHTQERELKARLELVRDLLQRLTGQRARGRRPAEHGGSTRLKQIVQILKDSDVALSAGAIYAKLRELDANLSWASPEPMFRAIIRRQPADSEDQVVRLQRGLYGLRGKHKRPVPPRRLPEGERPRLPPPLKKGSILAGAAKVLLDAGRPLHVAEILAGLAEEGIELRASDPKDSLKTNLNQSPRFVRMAPGVFDLAKGHTVAGERALHLSEERDDSDGPGR